VPNYLLNVDNPLVVPVGTKVRLLLTSQDVIHAWWVPDFGVKKDAIPGFVNELWFKADTDKAPTAASAPSSADATTASCRSSWKPRAEDYAAWLAEKKAAAPAAAPAAKRRRPGRRRGDHHARRQRRLTVNEFAKARVTTMATQHTPTTLTTTTTARRRAGHRAG
jgi:heme/copper-type cytochrome/quinol oxidase subunit 2